MKKVLIVDDAAFMRGSLKLILEQNGFFVAGEASNGLEGIKLYRELHPDIVTMDITMPELDGIEAIKIIRQIDSNARIIVISAMGQESKVKDAVIAGAKGFIVKPFKSEFVIETLNKALMK